MPAARDVEARSVADQVYGVLLRRIVAGDLPAGARLRQEALADELGVSRTPLREALRRLASEGFVEFAVNHGAAVALHDFSDPVSVRTARLHLEPATARLAAEVRDPAGLEELRRAVIGAAAAGPGPAALHAADAVFHLAVAETTGNPHLVRFAEMLWMARPAAGASARGAAAAAAPAGHAAIAGAVERGDAAEAERLSREHLAAGTGA